MVVVGYDSQCWRSRKEYYKLQMKVLSTLSKCALNSSQLGDTFSPCMDTSKLPRQSMARHTRASSLSWNSLSHLLKQLLLILSFSSHQLNTAQQCNSLDTIVANPRTSSSLISKNSLEKLSIHILKAYRSPLLLTVRIGHKAV